jgi:predicted metal-dependent hydrolase
MSIEARQIVVSGIPVKIERKRIKNLHLGVYPPDGRVRVAAPLAVSDEAVRLAVVGRLGWINRQRAAFAGQERQSPREMVGGESHYYLGRRYRLRVVERDGAPRIAVKGRATLELGIPRGTGAETRARALNGWYRARLKERVPEVLAKWEGVLGVRADAWGIKRMKTKWGSCNPVAGRIWLNLELAKKPEICLHYLVCHELAHLIEPSHNERFVALMDRAMPQWRVHRKTLNTSPLAHESWEY